MEDFPTVELEAPASLDFLEEKKSKTQFLCVTCGDPAHPELVLRAGEESNCFQQLEGVGGRMALSGAGGRSVHASLLNKYLFKCVFREFREQLFSFCFAPLQVGSRLISSFLP